MSAPAPPRSPTVPFEGVYLVTDELDRATHAEVDELERTLGCRMPSGYREYVTTLGEGTYCGVFRVHPPRQVLAERTGMRRFAFRFNGWTEHPGIALDDFVGSVEFADSSVGDVFAFHASRPDRILCMPDDGAIVAVDAATTRLEDLCWRAFPDDDDPPPGVRVFESRVNRAFRSGHPRDVVMHPETVVRALQHWFGRSGLLRVDEPVNPSGRMTILYIRAVQGWAEIAWMPDPWQPRVSRIGFRFSTAHADAAAVFGRWLETHRFSWR